MAHFEIDTDARGEYIWRLRAGGNNEIIADSAESYKDKEDCEKGIQLVKNQAPGADEQDLT